MLKPNVEAGLSHIRIDSEQDKISDLLGYINSSLAGEGNPLEPPIRSLVRVHKALALVSFFQDGNLEGLKSHAYKASFLARRVIHFKPYKQAYAQGYDLLYPLLSESSKLIHWHSQYQLPNFMMDRKKIRCFDLEKYEYHSVQPRLALQKDWTTLVERSEKALATKMKKNKLYEIDHRFYISLAKGDKCGMEDAIHVLTSPKVARHRNNELQWGIEQRLISGWGVILAKLAYWLGYELDIDSPWIPMEWLPISSPNHDEYPYDFLEGFDVFSSFDEVSNGWCDGISRFSPRDEQNDTPLSFDEISRMLGC